MHPILKLIGTFVVAVAVGAACYLLAAKARFAAPIRDELTWLRREFRLTGPELERVRQLHEAYLPKCDEMCRRIAAKNRECSEVLIASTNVSETVRQKLGELAVLRAECQGRMLEHFFEISQAMPPEQGRRYLAEMTRLALGLHEKQETAMTRTNAPGHAQP